MYYRCYDIDRFIDALASILAVCFIISLFINFWIFIIASLALIISLVYIVSLTKPELDETSDPSSSDDPRGYNTKIEDIL